MSVLGADQFTELLTSTRDKITTQGAVDNVTTPHPLLDALKSNFKNGTGESLRMSLQLAEDESDAFTDASGSFALDVSAPIIGAAVYAWSNPLVSKVRLVYKDLQMNTGPEQVVALATAHMKACEARHAKAIVQALHSTNAPVAGGFASLDQIVSDTAVLGGIDPATTPAWKASRLTIDSADASIKEAFRAVMNDIYDNGGGRPNIILAGGDVYDEYENSLDDAVRYNSFGTAETRFSELKFDGITVRRDQDCPRDRAYFLNTDSMELRYLNQNFMKVLDAQKIVGTLDHITPVASILATGTNNRRANGLLIRT